MNLGPLREAVERRVRAGSYASADEVIRASLLALEREEAATDEWLTHLAEDALADPRPGVPAEQVFRDLRAKHEKPAFIGMKKPVPKFKNETEEFEFWSSTGPGEDSTQYIDSSRPSAQG